MLAPQLLLAASIFVSCAVAEAAASPLTSMRPGALLHSDSGIEAVRWRYRYRSFWGGRGNSSVGRGARSEIFRLDLPRRRGWADPPPPR